MAARILLVEDDERVRASLRLVLEDEGFDVDEADTGEQALVRFGTRRPDVAVLDVRLPGIDGFEVCRQLRRLSDLPILMLTARSDSHDVVAGLEAGADDYIVKPAVPKELSARIRAALRRATRIVEQSVLTFGDVEIEPEGGSVRKGGAEVSLTRTEFKLLCELAFNRGIVLSRETLLERVWGYDYFGDARLVDVHIRRLRQKIEDDPATPQLVLTVRGLGYKLQHA